MPPKNDPKYSDDGYGEKAEKGKSTDGGGGGDSGNKERKKYTKAKQSGGLGQGNHLKKDKTQEGKKKYGSQSNLCQKFNQQASMGTNSNSNYDRNPQASGSTRPSGALASSGISSDQVKDVLECPVCFQIPRPPIYNCQTGHITCGDCRSRTSECPLCRQGYTNVRNFLAEKLAESCSFKCQFHEQGCEAMVRGEEETRHMNACNFRPVGCEIFPCKGKHIDYGTYLSHLRKEHHAGGSPNNQPKWERQVYVKQLDRILQQGYRVPYIINCFGQSFLQCAQAIGGKMWFWVSLLGTPEQAGRYQATIAISTKDRSVKSQWTGPVYSVRHSGDDIYFNGRCMVTVEECLKAFLYPHPEGFQCYSIEVTIEKLR